MPGTKHSMRFLIVTMVFPLVAPIGWADAPRVSFTLKKGWVTCRVTREDRPVTDANLKIIDGNGQAFADGDVNDEGVSEFPLPRTDSVYVMIQIADKSTDMIRLFREGEGVFPSEVLLTFGLTPCCRPPTRTESVAETNEAIASVERTYDMSVGAGIAAAVAFGMVLFMRRARTQRPARPDSESRA